MDGPTFRNVLNLTRVPLAQQGFEEVLRHRKTELQELKERTWFKDSEKVAMFLHRGLAHAELGKVKSAMMVRRMHNCTLQAISSSNQTLTLFAQIRLKQTMADRRCTNVSANPSLLRLSWRNKPKRRLKWNSRSCKISLMR